MASILKVYYKTCFTTGFIIGAYHGHIERMKRLNTDINIFETTPSLIRDGVIGGIISIILLPYYAYEIYHNNPTVCPLQQKLQPMLQKLQPTQQQQSLDDTSPPSQEKKSKLE